MKNKKKKLSQIKLEDKMTTCGIFVLDQGKKRILVESLARSKWSVV